MMLRRNIYVVFLILNLMIFEVSRADSGIGASGDKMRIGGYLESRQFLLTNFSDGELFGAWNRMKLEFRSFPDKRVDVEIAFRGNILSGFLAEAIIPDNSYDFRKIPLERETLTLDRAYAAINLGNSRFILGKQVIQQGVAYIFRPLDIYNPTYMLEPSFDIYGIPGIRVISSLGQLSELDLVFIPEKKLHDSRATAHLHTNLSGTDMGLSFIHYSGNQYIGIDVKGDLAIGYWFEGLSDLNFRGINQSVNYTLGFDYTFPMGNGFYFLCEFFHNSSGFSVKDYAENRYAAYHAGKLFLGKNYLASLLSYPLSNRLTAQALGIANLDDKSRIIALLFDWRPVYNISLNLGNYLNVSATGSEFAPAMPENLKLYEKASQFFIWVRIDF